MSSVGSGGIGGIAGVGVSDDVSNSDIGNGVLVVDVVRAGDCDCDCDDGVTARTDIGAPHDSVATRNTPSTSHYSVSGSGPGLDGCGLGCTDDALAIAWRRTDAETHALRVRSGLRRDATRHHCVMLG